MPRRPLGSTGAYVGAVGLGCSSFSLVGRPGEKESIRAIRAALDEGITLFDTADVYCLDVTDMGHNERLLAKALRGRSDAIVTTKGGYTLPGWKPNGDPSYLKRACENSLRALGAESIFLYQLHLPDPAVPFAESIGALADLQREGKIVHIGISNVSVEQLEEARTIVNVVSVQNQMSVFERSSWDVLKRCESLGIAFMPWRPLTGIGKAGGLNFHPVLSSVAAELDATPQQIAIAWLLHQSPVVIPIPGSGKRDHIVNNARAAAVRLRPEHLTAIEAAST